MYIKATMLDVSIILPTYNEKENIAILIPQLEGILKKQGLTSEILVVDDSSPDGTASVAEELNKEYNNIKVITRLKKEGIGAALREGYNTAQGKLIFSMDTDLSFDATVMPLILKRLEEGYDLIVGNRYSSEGDYEAKTSNVKAKRFVSKFGNKFLRFITGIDIHDFSTNFRGMKREAWQNIKTKEKNNTLLFEMILLTAYHGFKVGEQRIIFKDRVYGKSKLNLAKEAPKFLLKAINLSLKSRLRLM